MRPTTGEALDRNTMRLDNDDHAAATVQVRTVEEMLGTLASVVAELVDDDALDQEDKLGFHIVFRRHEVRVEVVPHDATHPTDDPLPPLTLRADPLTNAERNLLPYLATNLTFPLIAEHLCVSRNTVKTQAISIYRKLGVSSRDTAVRVARELGLLTRFVTLPTTSTPPDHSISA